MSDLQNSRPWNFMATVVAITIFLDLTLSAGFGQTENSSAADTY